MDNMEKAEALLQRNEMVRAEMKRKKVGALIIPRTEKMATVDPRYLTGFTGSMGFVVITQSGSLLAVDSRYTQQAMKETQGIVEVVEWQGLVHLMEVISKFIGRARKVGFIKSDVTVGFQELMQENIPSKTFIPLPPIVTGVRAVKSEEEILRITQALRATEAALEKTFRHVRPGVCELELAEVFERALPRGAKLAFDSIIASGIRSIEAHGLASDKIIEEGDVIQFDVGFAIDGYASDISRVVVCGTATYEQRRMHKAVSQAIKDSIVCYTAGTKTADAHNLAQKTLSRLGYDKDKFRHGLGHGMGLNVHEEPAVNPSYGGKFKVGHVASCEPAVYSESLKYGMRVEVDVVIRENGPEILDELQWDKLVETDSL